jgi:hypothetical protein
MQSAGGARPSSPEAHAFSAMIDERLPGHRPKYPLEPISERAASAAAPAQLEAVMKDAGFGAVDVQTVTQTIAFPSVVDYVRFQLLATPMTALLPGPPQLWQHSRWALARGERPCEGQGRARPASGHLNSGVEDDGFGDAGDPGRRQVYLPAGAYVAIAWKSR